MTRTTLRIAGESGSGLASLERILMSALKSLGFYLHADREYPSVIKGGHAVVQFDFGPEPIFSLSQNVNVLLALDSPGLIQYIDTVREGGVVIHTFERHERVPSIAKTAAEKNLTMLYVPARAMAMELAHTDLVANMVLLGFLWKVFGLDQVALEGPVKKQFASKPKLLKIDLKCLAAGYSLEVETPVPSLKPVPAPMGPNTIVLDGNMGIALGAIQAGVRAYYAYPMSPASSVLAYLGQMAEASGMVVKQAEEEITAAQMAIGSMHMGTRALTATSGGGYDLMTETVSLAAITEIPLVIVIAQRPGPATGLPTWTAQGDLNLAMYAGHGEFARLVVAGSDAESCYELIQHAFNYAETYQIPVIFLTEKIIAESKFMHAPFKHGAIPIERGLVTDPEELAKLLSTDRYRLTENGVSKRWLPGSGGAHYYANSDEHLESGVLTEDGDKAQAMMDKRMRKLNTLRAALPEPVMLGPDNADVSFVGWGSTKNLMRDVIRETERQGGTTVNYLHFDYLYPLRTERLRQLFANNARVCLIEGNHQGQFGRLIETETGLKFHKKFLRYNGRPFFMEEVMEFAKDTDQ